MLFARSLFTAVEGGCPRPGSTIPCGTSRSPIIRRGESALGPGRKADADPHRQPQRGGQLRPRWSRGFAPASPPARSDQSPHGGGSARRAPAFRMRRRRRLRALRDSDEVNDIFLSKILRPTSS